ncbi:hypothetical protein JTB14_034962 [Gonioctena quinquepunctata]|nr:hypothetical protein JTB14_034962 [Gonioctena quinquepunctata]
MLMLLLIINNSDGEILFQSGWYKAHQKGRRHNLSDVSYIDSSIVPDTKYLRIRAKIPNIFRGGIRKLENVETLKIVLCGISEVEPGSFENLPNLKTLALHDNVLEQIRVGVFNHLHLSKLYLHRNKIQVIESQAFDDMPELILLKLNSNSISFLDSNWFKNTPRLTELFFRRNQLRSIPSGAFRNIKGSHNFDGTRIYLSKNYISSIDPTAFSELKEMNQLWLDRNELEELDENLFINVDHIGVLSLMKNRLKTVPRDFLKNFKSDLLILDLANNNNITCLDYDLVSKVKMTNLQRINKLDCECVKKLVVRLKENSENNEISSECNIGDDQIH